MQGEALSPFLFSLYINDFENELINGFSELFYIQQISHFFIYADKYYYDARVCSSLDSLHVYSTKWNIDVNIDKIKIVVFRNRGKLTNTQKWTYDGNIIQFVNNFNYLILTLYYNGNFTQKTPKILIVLQGKKSMDHILRLCHNLCSNKETQVHVFDTCVSNVLNYGCEILEFVPDMMWKTCI